MSREVISELNEDQQDVKERDQSEDTDLAGELLDLINGPWYMGYVPGEHLRQITNNNILKKIIRFKVSKKYLLHNSRVGIDQMLYEKEYEDIVEWAKLKNIGDFRWTLGPPKEPREGAAASPPPPPTAEEIAAIMTAHPDWKIDVSTGMPHINSSKDKLISLIIDKLEDGGVGGTNTSEERVRAMQASDEEEDDDEQDDDDGEARGQEEEQDKCSRVGLTKKGISTIDDLYNLFKKRPEIFTLFKNIFIKKVVDGPVRMKEGDKVITNSGKLGTIKEVKLIPEILSEPMINFYEVEFVDKKTYTMPMNGNEFEHNDIFGGNNDEHIKLMIRYLTLFLMGIDPLCQERLKKQIVLKHKELSENEQLSKECEWEIERLNKLMSEKNLIKEMVELSQEKSDLISKKRYEYT